MKRPNLIQRLKEPRDNCIAWAFTGTYDGGFSEKQIDILNPILQFDNMGTAELEFGEVRDAFNNTYGFLSTGQGSYGTVDLQKPVFYLSSNEDRKEVIHFLEELAEKGDSAFRLQKPTWFKETLEGITPEYKGWIEITNPFMFFVDKKMYESIKNLFI